MQRTSRKVVRVVKYLLAGVAIFCVSWIACVAEWHSGVRWDSNVKVNGPTVRTIVAYSESKRAEMERPNPVTCDSLPAYPSVSIINRTWSRGDWDGWSSWQRVDGSQVMLFNAYYDGRLPQHYIRILASFPGRIYPIKKMLFCQTRPMATSKYDAREETVEVVAAKPLEIWHNEWDKSTHSVRTALLLSCPLTEPFYIPTIVSIVTQPCDDPANAFLINNDKDKVRKNFTLCVKDMHFEKDISEKIIEWIEANKIVGVDKIDMYIDRVHEKTEKILEYYRNLGFVRLFHVPIKHIPDGDLWQRRRDHIITYNDCLYRNLRESKYIIPLDVDEIVMPKIADDLLRLTERLEQAGWDDKESSAAIIRNVFFLEFMQRENKYKCNKSKQSDIYVKRDDVRIEKVDISTKNKFVNKNKLKNRCRRKFKSPRILEHTMRSMFVSPEGAYSKSLMVTDNVLTAFNHYPLASLNYSNTYWFAPFEEVQLNHYKKSCNSTTVPECGVYESHSIEDCTAMKFQDKLITALSRAPCN